MARQRILRATDVHRAIYVVVVFFFIGAAVDAHVSWYLRRPDGPWSSFRTLTGDLAALHGWPISTPDTEIWPPPDSWTAYSDLGYTGVEASISRETSPGEFMYTHHLRTERSGWPLASFERVEGFGTSPDVFIGSSTYHPVWTGLILNPLFWATLLFALFYLPFAGASLLRRVIRAGDGRCVWCGYKLGSGTKCTECGADVRAAP